NLGTYTVDRADSSVTGKVWGFASRKAIYRYGLGATLVSGMTAEELREQRIERAAAPSVNQDTMDWPMGDRVGRLAVGSAAADRSGGGPGAGGREVEDTLALQQAVGMAFGDKGTKETGTRAVIVVHHGRIVAERYSPGFDRHTRLTGWSMTKGITN